MYATFSTVLPPVSFVTHRLQHLEVLDVSDNQLDSLPYSMGYMKSLKELHLSGNPLREFYKLFAQRPERYGSD